MPASSPCCSSPSHGLHWRQPCAKISGCACEVTIELTHQRTASLRSALALSGCLYVLACALLAPLSISACVALSIGSVLLSFGVPAVLVHAQRYKEYAGRHRGILTLCSEIRGPWDAAVPSSI